MSIEDIANLMGFRQVTPDPLDCICEALMELGASAAEINAITAIIDITGTTIDDPASALAEYRAMTN